MQIRKLNKYDRSELKRIFQMQKAAYKIESKILHVKSLPPLSETLQDIENSTDEVFIGLIDSLPVGAIFLEKSNNVIIISKLIVAPEYFRQGIAKGLLNYCLTTYPNTNFQVETGVKNNPALQLYRSLRFQVFSETILESNLKILKLERSPYP